MDTVLVTGVTGFLGSHLITSLRDSGKYHLVGMVRNPKAAGWLEQLGVEVRVADLVRPSSLKGVTRDVDVVVHLAALMRFHDPWESLVAHNVEGTKVLASDAMAQGVGHFVYMSSTEATGPVASVPGDECAEYRPVYEYGRSKMLAELWLREQQGRLPVTVVRPTGIYGPGDTYVTLPVLRAVQRGLTRMLPRQAAEHCIQFTYVSDVVQGIMAVVERRERVVGETFVLASDDFYSYRELFVVLSEVLGVPGPRYSVPVWLVRGVLRYFEWVNRRKGVDEFVFHASLVDDMVVDRVYSNAKAKRMLGFHPEFLLRRGIAEVLLERSCLG